MSVASRSTPAPAEAAGPQADLRSAGAAPAGAPASGEPRLRAKDAIIRLRGLRKAFGHQVVLDGIDLDIPRGRTTVVLGPSGCGKSVTLKHIVGLLRPDAGEVYFEDQRVDTLSEAKLREIRLQVGFLFQMGALFDSMTVRENLLFPLREHSRLHSRERNQRVAEALDRVDLHGVAGKLPSQLSGGQRKRVALARAIVLEPRVVLYDEPTTGLDPIRSDGIDQLVLKLERELGVTSVVVTHDLVSARKIAAKVVMLLDGKIVAEGTYAQVESWDDPRVQQFMQGRYLRDDDTPPEPSVSLPPISRLLQPKTWRGPAEKAAEKVPTERAPDKGSRIAAPGTHEPAPGPEPRAGTPRPEPVSGTEPHAPAGAAPAENRCDQDGQARTSPRPPDERNP